MTASIVAASPARSARAPKPESARRPLWRYWPHHMALPEKRQCRSREAPIELDSGQVAEVRELIPTAIYDRGQRTIALRVDGEPDEQFAALSGLADALGGALSVS